MTSPDAAAPGPADDGSTVVLVARSFAGPVSFDVLHKLEEDAAWCLEANGVRHLRSYFATSQQRMICL